MGKRCLELAWTGEKEGLTKTAEEEKQRMRRVDRDAHGAQKAPIARKTVKQMSVPSEEAMPCSGHLSP